MNLESELLGMMRPKLKSTVSRRGAAAAVETVYATIAMRSRDAHASPKETSVCALG